MQKLAYYAKHKFYKNDLLEPSIIKKINSHSDPLFKQSGILKISDLYQVESMTCIHDVANEKLELVYLPKGKYCVYPRMVYRLAIVMRPPPPPFWMTEDHFRSHFSLFQINTQLGCRRPFWMTENHFWSHLSSFQFNKQLLFFLKKWLLAAILDDQKSLLIALAYWPFQIKS